MIKVRGEAQKGIDRDHESRNCCVMLITGVGGVDMESTQTEDDDSQSEEDVEKKEGRMARDDPSETR
jgi:hypothetical protein